jgi:hypothetical protein
VDLIKSIPVHIAVLCCSALVWEEEDGERGARASLKMGNRG